MANRRQGHGGGRPYYNNGPVNPWQGGNVPGGNAAGGAFNSANPSNLLSQLTEPQAQLALALTKLLQPQQQVPSLLTMDTVNPLHNRGGYGPNKNSYPQGGSRADLLRRARHGFKRNEPYNKIRNHNVRDTEFKRRRGNSNKSDERKIQAHRSTTVASTNKPNKTTPSVKASATKPDKQTNEVKPVDDDLKPEPTPSAADSTADTSHIVVKDTSDTKSEDESKDEKRDWKEEKSSEEVADAKTATEDNETAAKEEAVKEKVVDAPVVVEKKAENDRYAGIPADLLHCLICQKSMWDGESFEKHMNGRAHQQMFEKVEESYKIKADMMREAIRLAEEKNNIEMDRMKRLGKKTKAQQRSRCAMCDLEFYGQLFVHRKSASHQKLKHFLHPRCNYCNKEFPTRMEWENHRHSPEHLRKKVEVDKKKDFVKDEDEILLDDECFVVIDSTDNDEQDDPNALTDLTDDLTDLQMRIPSYKANRAVGLSLISPATGFFCKPCARFFLTEEASQLHAQSRMHFNAFIKILNEKIAENEEKKRKTAVDEDDEGNWKRRKVAAKDDDDKNDNEGSLIADEEHKEEVEEKKADTSELYDPADAFITTDPNDICLTTDNIKQESVKIEDEGDKVKTEPEEGEDEGKIKTETSASPVKTTNVKNNIGPRRTRAAAGKKSM